MARCLATGEQRLGCGGELHVFKGHEYGEHEGECGDDVWTGEWPGVGECQKRGWYAVLKPVQGWQPCTADTSGAVEDLNRLYRDTKWDPATKTRVDR